LFVERDFDPFNEHGIERPGLELIANFIEARSRLRRVRVTVFVPAEQCGDEMLRRSRRRSGLCSRSSAFMLTGQFLKWPPVDRVGVPGGPVMLVRVAER